MTHLPGFERLAIHAMGTRFEAALSGASPADLRSAGEVAFQEILELHARWSAFDPGSLLTRVNRLAAGRAVPIDGETFEVLALARSLWEATDGTFDPTTGAAMRTHGFRPSRPDTDPGASARASADAPLPGMGAVELDPGAGTVRFLDPRVELDLGALAKGVALDREGRIPSVRLRDAALGVSAGHGRGAAIGGGGHVLDPRTGRPGSVDRFAAVVGDSAAVADAWATAWVVRALPSRTPESLSVLAGLTDGETPTEVTHRSDPRGAFSPPPR